MFCRILSVLLITGMVGGCLGVGQRGIVSKSADVKVTLFSSIPAAPTTYDALTDQAFPGATDKTKPALADYRSAENDLATACTPQPRLGAVAPLVAAVAGYAVDKVVGYVVDQIDKKLQKELKKYTQSFEGSTAASFYASGSLNELGHQCIRITRYYTKDKTKHVAMDFVASLAVESDSALAIQPLRLYYRKAQAKTDKDNKYGVSINLAMDAVWREENSPKQQEKAVDAVVLADDVVLSEDGFIYRVYKTLGTLTPAADEARKPKHVALPPWSHFGLNSVSSSFITTTVTVSEAGNVDWWLEKGADLFQTNKDKVNEKMKAAITQLLKDKAGIDTAADGN